MKTTDSVKDKFIKWLVEESGEPEHLIMLMQSVYINPESMFKFYSHSLAEARREWVEVVRGMKKKRLDSPRGLGDGQVVNVAPGYNQAIDDVADLLTGDNPERKV